MDIASGYWNVPITADSIEKTAFTCKYGLYEWLVMPFRLCNAVPAFERLMENVLVDLKWRTCSVYLDDCVVFSEDFPTHLVRLKQVLERFRTAGFKLKMKKCKWGLDQVAFLGHIVTPSGILPNPEKVKAVMNVKRPHDLHTVRAFLGLTSYYGRYIPGYVAISAPIERLKAKGDLFDWNDDCEAAFVQLKRKLVEPPILVYHDFSKRFELYVESSKLAVGACLMQTVDGRERVVAYASKLLVGSEKDWINKQDVTSEIECWGIACATRKFRCYVDRREFDFYTDHKALTWVFSETNRTSNAKLARWAMELSQLRFKVYHKAGSSMDHVGSLSRLYSDTHAFWHGWKRDVTEYVRECSTCGSGKRHRPWRNGLMQRMPIHEPSGPFSLLVVDAVDPLVATPRGNKFILVFADYFTRWVEHLQILVSILLLLSKQCAADDDPLTEDDLPSTSFVERLVIGGEETAFSGTNYPVIDIIAKRKKDDAEPYLVLMATYEVSWRATATLLSNYRALIREFEDTRRQELGLPGLRRSARLAEANATVDEDELLFKLERGDGWSSRYASPAPTTLPRSDLGSCNTSPF
ncbi:unnamed protein product [Phytophthora fragariaefolia]|uniref:Unnamed protein product n=1 Tax=Phytophthora fragariaefolia TaxID=1490495 RepID=A0A9W6X9S8_9STRA|nr:unnamed protein product [Phytophthora fragariaefolia]